MASKHREQMTTVSTDIQVVFLGQNGDIRQGKLKTVTPASIMSALKKKDAPSLLGHYIWGKKTLFLFGYAEGKAKAENQHHLPPPLEGMTFYGDILVIASLSPTSYASKTVHLKTSDYETFYTNKLEGEEEEEELYDEEEESNAKEGGLVDDEGDLSEGEEDAEDLESVSESESEEEEEEAESYVSSEEEKVIEKPIRVSRARKVAVAQVEEPEIDETDPLQNSFLRKKILSTIESLLGDHLKTAEEKEEMEKILFQTSLKEAEKVHIRKSWSNISFCDIYQATSRRIIGNLLPSTYVANKWLWERFVSKELTLEQIANQNYYELCPESWQLMIDRQAKRERVQIEGDFSRATDKYFCKGCKMRKCTYYELQTRSADEPMTIFIHCLNCGKRWTQ